jgi:hypothetical protein
MIKAGFGRCDITPPLGIKMGGYYRERISDGVLDKLEVTALALENEGAKALLIGIDNEGLRQNLTNDLRNFISGKTNIPFEAIIISATHSHTSPMARKDSGDVLVESYVSNLYEKMLKASELAILDLKESSVYVGEGNSVGVDEVYFTDTGAGKSLNGKAADPADTEYRDARLS